MPPSPPSFGKRNAPRPTGQATPRAVLQPEHAALFAVIRAETYDNDERPVAVPRSVRAALLAGLVVGFCLAGLDATRADATLRRLAGLVPGGAPQMLPVVILLGLFGGARAAAANLLFSHWLLRRMGWSGHLAYTVGGGMVAACVATLTRGLIDDGLIEPDMLRGHGWAVDVAAGAGAGFFYRVFAGSARA